jgi:hypothetical protein
MKIYFAVISKIPAPMAKLMLSKSGNITARFPITKQECWRKRYGRGQEGNYFTPPTQNSQGKKFSKSPGELNHPGICLRGRFPDFRCSSPDNHQTGKI